MSSVTVLKILALILFSLNSSLVFCQENSDTLRKIIAMQQAQIASLNKKISEQKFLFSGPIWYFADKDNQVCALGWNIYKYNDSRSESAKTHIAKTAVEYCRLHGFEKLVSYSFGNKEPGVCIRYLDENGKWTATGGGGMQYFYYVMCGN